MKHEGWKVLMVEQGLAARLKGYVLDYEDTAYGMNFIVLKGG